MSEAKVKLSELFKKFFDERSGDLFKQNIQVLIVREDGLMIYRSEDCSAGAGLDVFSVGALIGGVWQAARSLTHFMDEFSEDESQLHFGTSSRGFFLLPLHVDGEEYTLGTVYENCLNPGKLKNMLRLLRDHMEELFKTSWKSELVSDTDERLFPFISDEEIDKLFENAGI